MPNNNAIGTGALILTANADRLVAGLDAASAKATKFAGSLEQKMSSAAGVGKGPGLISRLLGGALTGGVAGAAFVLAEKGVKALVGAFDMLDARAKGVDKGSLRAIKGSFGLLIDGALDLAQKLLTAAAPAIVTMVEMVLSVMEKLAPVIDGAAKVYERLWYVGAEAFAALVDGIGWVLDQAADLVGGTDAIMGAMSSMGEVTMRVLRVMGKGFAYVWDGVKAGVGVVAVVAGAIVEAFGAVIKVIGEAAKKLSDLASVLPEAIRPDWVGRVGETVKGWGDSVDGVGEKMRKWGAGVVRGFGDSAPMVDDWFDRIDKGFSDRKKGFLDLANMAAKPQLAGAFQKGDAASYSIVAKYSAGNMLSDSNKQLKEQQKGNDILNKIKNQLERGPVIKAG